MYKQLLKIIQQNLLFSEQEADKFIQEMGGAANVISAFLTHKQREQLTHNQ